MTWRIPLVIYAPAARRGGALTILCDVMLQLIKDKQSAIVIIHPDAAAKIPTSALFDVQSLKWVSRFMRLAEDFCIAPQMIRSICPDGARIICLSNRALRLDSRYIQHVFVHNLFAISRKAPKGSGRTRTTFFYTLIYPHILAANFRTRFFYHVQRPSLKPILRQNYRGVTKVSVIPPVVSKSFVMEANAARRQNIIKKPILFCPLAANPHKNLPLLARVAPLIAKHNLRIVVTVTPENWVVQTNSPVSKNVDCIGYVSLQEMAELYLSAQAMVFPSLFETAGLPLLEAKFMNCPVIASDLSFTHDLLGDYDHLVVFNPQSEESLYTAILQSCCARDK